jgi:hypothetical protein
LGGAAAAPLASAGRRTYVSTIESREAKGVAKDFLKPFRDVVEKLESDAAEMVSKDHRPPLRSPKHLEHVRLRQQAQLARDLLKKEEKILEEGMVSAARKARRESPFGGALTGKVREATRAGEDPTAEWSSRTHLGQIMNRLEAIQKEHDLPVSFNVETARVPDIPVIRPKKPFWEQYVKSVFEKRSSSFEEAFISELVGISMEKRAYDELLAALLHRFGKTDAAEQLMRKAKKKKSLIESFLKRDVILPGKNLPAPLHKASNLLAEGLATSPEALALYPVGGSPAVGLYAAGKTRAAKALAPELHPARPRIYMPRSPGT